MTNTLEAHLFLQKSYKEQVPLPQTLSHSHLHCLIVQQHLCQGAQQLGTVQSRDQETCPTGTMEKAMLLWSIWLYRTELFHSTYPQGWGMSAYLFYLQI